MADYEIDVYDEDFDDISERPCKFPFIFKNKTYYNCTYDYVLTSPSTRGYPWCSLETDENNNHVKDIGRCVDPVNCNFSWKETASEQEIQLVKENQGRAWYE